MLLNMQCLIPWQKRQEYDLMNTSRGSSRRTMKSLNNQVSRSRLKSKIAFIEKQISSLDNYLPETYEYLMSVLDSQKCLLAEIEVKNFFLNVDNDQEGINE